MYCINNSGKAAEVDAEKVILDTKQWLKDMVVGLNLCPFSHPAVAKDLVHFAVCRGKLLASAFTLHLFAT